MYFLPQHNSIFNRPLSGRYSSVGIATRYGLDGKGIQSQWGWDFPHLIQTGPDPHPASYTMGTGTVPGVNRMGRGVDHPPPHMVKFKERVELYVYSPPGHSW